MCQRFSASSLFFFIKPTQGKAAQAIAREIQVTLTPEDEVRLTSARPVNPEAYQLYLRGKYHQLKGSIDTNKEEFERADEYFQQAIEVDPNCAQAYAGLAGSHVFVTWAYPTTSSWEEGRSRAEKFVSIALKIDDKLPEARLAHSGCRDYYRRATNMVYGFGLGDAADHF